MSLKNTWRGLNSLPKHNGSSWQVTTEVIWLERFIERKIEYQEEHEEMYFYSEPLDFDEIDYRNLHKISKQETDDG